MIKCVLKKIWSDVWWYRECIYLMVFGLLFIFCACICANLWPVATAILFFGGLVLFIMYKVTIYLHDTVVYCWARNERR